MQPQRVAPWGLHTPPPTPTVSPRTLPWSLSSPYLGNFDFILLFGHLERLIMVPCTVIVHQLPPSLGNA